MNPVLERISREAPGRSESEGLLEWYRALGQASGQMLEAARSGDWDTVCRIEGASTVLVAQLRSMRRSMALGAAQERERLEILRGIVLNDAEIRRIMAPLPAWLH